MRRENNVKYTANYLNVGPIHIKLSDFDRSITQTDIDFVKTRLENMFREVQEQFLEYKKPARIITMLMPDKLGVMSFDGKNIRFYIIDTTKKTIATSLDFVMAKKLAMHDVTYIKRAHVLSRLQQEYPGQPKELFSEIELKLSSPTRAGPKGYVWNR